MSIDHGRETPENFSPGDGILGLLKYDVLQAHLEEISHLDQTALMTTLLPHRHLPSFDPAGYVIAHHSLEPQEHIQVNSTYDLGVVFASSLFERARSKDQLKPVVSEFDAEKRQVVDEYLLAAANTPVDILIRKDDPAVKYINNAVNLFAHRCKVIVPHLMLDGKEALFRGAHDYLSVVSLLEAPKEYQRLVFGRALGRLSLGGHPEN